MIIKSITNPDWLKITDEATKNMYFGCDQNWYHSEWQRRAGCGPSVASNIFHYLTHSKPLLDNVQNQDNKETFVTLMEGMWKYVTPKLLGVHTTKIFYKGFMSFSKIQGLNMEYACFNVPKRKAARRKLSNLLVFLEEAISKDTPVAFLNLQNGEEKNLDSWHWVTIISIEFTEDRDNLFAVIYDGGITKKINLSLWYDTTMLGGGFVYFIKTKCGLYSKE